MDILLALDLATLFDSGAVIVVALLSMISSLTSIFTLFIDEGKVKGFFKPAVKVLNFLSLNIFKNKNATDV